MKTCGKVVGAMLLAMAAAGCAKQDVRVSALVRTDDARPVAVDLAEIVKP
jgi:hypothetical protein